MRDKPYFSIGPGFFRGRSRTFILLWVLWLGAMTVSTAQPGAVIDLPKPSKYENRTLASERTGSGRINPVRKVQQNIVTRYNFYFNAANELDEVIESARRSSKFNYTRLLPFEEYPLESTAAQKEELDSVILKCNNGILLHDLRNDWVDDLYLLMGMAYFHRKEFDSAEIAFQYINYAFQPRSRDEIGTDKAIGSRLNEKGNVYTISTPERRGVIPRLLSHTSARNEAVIWLLRTLIEQGRMNEAVGLIETLRRDQSLPSRLRPRLEECQALWFYRSSQWDSAAIHLEASLPVTSPPERARREFLAAQLYGNAGMTEDAERMYAAAILHTTDPVLEANARIHQIGLDVGAGDSIRIRRSLAELDRMSRRSRYEDYRQIVHYAASRLELKQGDTLAAIDQLRQSIRHGGTDATLKTRAFRELADIAFAMRDYPMAAQSYDSVQTELLEAADTQQVALRARVLHRVASLLTLVRRQDSLLRIAAMPEAERREYVLKLSRALRKAQGLKEEAELPVSTAASPSILKDDTPVNLFAANEGKGEWYFYNGTLRLQGFRQFQAKWGKRPNVDNWRRIAAVEAMLNAASQTAPGAPGDPGKPAIAKASEPETTTGPQDLSFDGLIGGLPLTDSLRNLAHETIQASLLELGLAFREDLEMCSESVAHLTSLLDRYPQTTLMETVLFNLCTCLRQTGDMTRFEFYRRELSSRYGRSPFLAMLENPIGVQEAQSAERRAADAEYDRVVNLLVQGRFDEAMELKRTADSGYGRKYWTSQLQYLEALYLIRERRDSLALLSLKGIRDREPGSPLAIRSAELEKVLARRAEIEDYLTKLDIKRYPEDSLVLPPEEPVVRTVAAPVKDSANANIKPLPSPDSSRAGLPEPAPVIQPDSVNLRTVFLHRPAEGHAVILVLTKVDVVYRTEARISLNKYHQATRPDAGLTAVAASVTDDVKLVRIAPFDNLSSAMEYWKSTRDLAAKEIFPWLPAGTYRFLPISLPNLELLLQQRDINAYMSFLHQSMPDEF
jgi:tetratricopeptide (TPR) repeat protein